VANKAYVNNAVLLKLSPYVYFLNKCISTVFLLINNYVLYIYNYMMALVRRGRNLYADRVNAAPWQVSSRYLTKVRSINVLKKT